MDLAEILSLLKMTYLKDFIKIFDITVANNIEKLT